MPTAQEIADFVNAQLADESLSDAQRAQNINDAKAVYNVSDAEIASAITVPISVVTQYLAPSVIYADSPSDVFVVQQPVKVPAMSIYVTADQINQYIDSVLSDASTTDARKAALIRQQAADNYVTYQDIASARQLPVQQVIDFLELQGQYADPIGRYNVDGTEARVYRDPNEVVRNDGSAGTITTAVPRTVPVITTAPVSSPRVNVTVPPAPAPVNPGPVSMSDADVAQAILQEMQRSPGVYYLALKNAALLKLGVGAAQFDRAASIAGVASDARGVAVYRSSLINPATGAPGPAVQAVNTGASVGGVLLTIAGIAAAVFGR